MTSDRDLEPSKHLKFPSGPLEELIALKQSQAIEASMYAGKIDKKLAVSVVEAIKPKNPVERMLVNHMIRVHNAIIRLGDGLDQCFSVEQLNAYQNGLNKSARTFIGQMDMLKRYQSGNEQSIHVQNVSVSDGGQAIVGNVNAQPAPIKASEPPPALTDAKTVAMPIIQNNDRSAVPATPKSKEKK